MWYFKISPLKENLEIGQFNIYYYPGEISYGRQKHIKFNGLAAGDSLIYIGVRYILRSPMSEFIDSKTVKNSFSLIDRLEKDVKGSLTTILILGIIRMEGRTWGYQIKKKLKEVTKNDSYIKDSSLYTILRNLETHYKLVVSEMEERRRYYSLTDRGVQQINQAFTYWLNLVRSSSQAFEELGFTKALTLVEVV